MPSTQPHPSTAQRSVLDRPLHHVSYVVADVAAAAEMWRDLYGVGPFLALERMEFDRSESPLGEAVFDHTAAFGAWGDIAVELQQIFEVRPAKLETAFAGVGRLNHVSYVVDDPEAESARLTAMGLPRIFSAQTGPVEVVFHDVPTLGHCIEIHRDTAFLREFFGQLRTLAADWDGSEPLRVAALG